MSSLFSGEVLPVNIINSLKACNLIKETPIQVFFCEIVKVLKNNFLIRNTASDRSYGTLLLIDPPLMFLWLDTNDFKTTSLHHTLNPQMAYYALLAYFFQCQDIDSRAKPLITQPYRNWNDAKEDLNNYQVLQYHKDSMGKLNKLISCCENPNARIENSISKSSTRVIYRSRKYLSAVMRAI